MLPLIWIGIIVIVGVGVVLYLRQKQLGYSSPRGELPPLERTVFTLQIGDIVEYMDVDWVVEGKLTYEDKGYTWIEYLLRDSDRVKWLSVDEDDLVEISLLEPTDSLEITGEPPQQLIFAGETYKCVEAGSARMSRTGATLQRKAQHCRYFDYTGPGNKVLSIEDWNGEMEVTVGQTIRPSMLTLLPGDGRRVY